MINITLYDSRTKQYSTKLVESADDEFCDSIIELIMNCDSVVNKKESNEEPDIKKRNYKKKSSI